MFYFLQWYTFLSSNLARHNLKMSESENKVEHDRNGYLNCQQCSRRYLTLVGFVNHVKLEHGDVNPKQIETKQDSICVSNDVVHSKIQPKFKEDQNYLEIYDK